MLSKCLIQFFLNIKSLCYVNRDKLCYGCDCKPLMYIKKSEGSRIEPCVTPSLITFSFDTLDVKQLNSFT